MGDKTESESDGISKSKLEGERASWLRMRGWG